MVGLAILPMSRHRYGNNIAMEFSKKLVLLDNSMVNLRMGLNWNFPK